MKRSVMMSLVMVIAVVICSVAAVPHLINFQGVLTDDSGSPITGAHDLTFTVYPDSGQGSPVYWTETHTGVLVDNGLYNVIIGAITPIPQSLFAQETRWIGIAVDGGAEMTPRMQITAVPWAIHAAVADSVLSGGGGGELSLPFADSTSVGYSAFAIDNAGQGAAIKGENSANNNSGYLGHTLVGVLGNSATAGVRGINDNGNYGQLGDGNQGVYGQHYLGHYGHLGGSTYGGYGRHTNGNRGYLGNTNYGVAGYSDTVAVHGYNSDVDNYGRLGGRSFGAFGRFSGGNQGYLGTAVYGVLGYSETIAVSGSNNNGNFGRLGTSIEGVRGEATETGNVENFGGYFVAHGDSGIGVYGESAGGGYGGYFVGSVLAEGTVHSTSGGFRFPDGTVQTTAAAGGEGLALPYAETVYVDSTAFLVENHGPTSNAVAVHGGSVNGFGVYGSSGVTGVKGESSGAYGVQGVGPTGVHGEGGVGLEGSGVYGIHSGSGNHGYIGGSSEGVYGEHNSTGTGGRLGTEWSGVHGSGSGSAAGVIGVNTTSQKAGWLGGADYGVKSTGDLVVENGDAVVENGDLVVEGAYRGNIGPNFGAPFPRPAYDSTWWPIAKGQVITLNHGINGNVDNYVVDMMFQNEDGVINNLGFGGMAWGQEFRGASWSDLSQNHILVTRSADDPWIDKIRIRIWVYN